MADKVVFLGDGLSPPALLASVAEREGLDGLVMVYRVDGRWQVRWSSGVDLGSLSMAALKLLSAVEDVMHGMPTTWSPPEKAPA